MPANRASIHRRRRNLLAGALAAFALGLAVGASSGDDERAGTPAPDPKAREAPARADAAPVDGLTLRQQVGQLIVLRFAGTTVPGYVRDALRERRAAGAILFRDNVADPTQLRALTRALRRAGGRPIVAVDQEGGEIRIVPWAAPSASAPQQQAAGSVRADAEAAGSALRRLGITVSLAPVGDVPSVAGAALGGRAFASEPDAASDAMAAAVRGWRAGGVAATAKHFPGLGGATVNTDDGPATVARSRAELESTDLPPFAAAIAAGVPLVMVGHARYPTLDPDRIASQSQPIVGDLLRERMGFRGVVVTDSMEARASLATGDIATVSERAVRAGADLLLLTGRGSYAPVYQHLLAVAERSPAFRERVRESAARVLALKRDTGPP
ncbi:MAG TPA: glycoside hydrolase family 3 N-terminal domain-containing protein [Solirubrobacteraceae bacterium]|nr:glycoside hydrolase family 3 N-terminal domain-containing protein [Solirubrobacteraceae bacterium]